MKSCSNSDCQQQNPQSFSEFHKQPLYASRDGYKSKCKHCRKLERYKEYSSANAYRKANPLRSKGKNLIRFWPGSTWQEALNNYNELLTAQNGVCAICERPETSRDKLNKIKWLAVDHCHKTNKVRGILCDKCNRGIGFLSDTAEMCKKAALYLQKSLKQANIGLNQANVPLPQLYDTFPEKQDE